MVISLTTSHEKLLAYLVTRIESAGTQNNLMKDNPFEFLNGFIDAICIEREAIEFEVITLSKQFNIPVIVVHKTIDEALNQVYNRYVF